MTGRRRSLTLLWALLQVALPAFAGLAEASVAAASRTATAHVEEHSGPGCQPVHAPDCARCQTLSTHATAAVPIVDGWRIAPEVAYATDVIGTPRGPRLALPLSRAPPQPS